MSKWNEIRHGVKKVAIKAVSKTADVTDTASLHVKLAQKEANLADFYEQFGRVAYQKAKTGANVEHKARVLIEKIDIIRSEIAAIRRAIDEKKVAREEEIGNAIEVEQAVEKAEKENTVQI